MNKVKTKNSEGFSGRNQKFKRFFRPKTGDLQKKGLHGNSGEFSGRNPEFQTVFPAENGGSPKKEGLHPKNVMKSGASPQKLQKYRWQTPIWASICSPVAPSLLISLGHSPRLGGHNFHFGGARPQNAAPWRCA